MRFRLPLFTRPPARGVGLAALVLVGLSIFGSASYADNAFVEVEKITPSPTSSGNSIGSAVDISGDWAVIGGGKVFVLRRVGGVWSYFKQLSPTGVEDSSGFGNSVAINGNTIAVGATTATVGLPTLSNAGAVYIFEKDQGGSNNWGQTQRLIAGSGEASANGNFGTAIALDNFGIRPLLLIGMPEGGTGNTGSGRAQVFEKGDTGWIYQYTLAPSDGVDNDNFGFSLDLFNDIAVVGSTGWPDKKAYVYMLPATGTVVTEKKLSPNGGPDAPGTFGNGIAVQGTTLAISNFGSVELFERHEGGTNNWGYVETLAPAVFNSSFGHEIGLYGSTLLVGDLTHSSARGKVSVYRPGGSSRGASWTFTQDILAADGLNGDFFSSGIAVDLGTAIIGASQDDNSEGNGAGAAYLFEDLPATSLSLTLDDGSGTTARGGSTEYTVQVSNETDEDVDGAIVDVDVVLGQIDSGTSSWTCAPDPGTTAETSCSAAGTVAQLASGITVDLGAGESLTILFDVDTLVSNPAATLQTVGTVTPPVALAEATPDDNTVTDVNSFVNEADLAIDVVASTDNPPLGGTIFFTATLSSDGPSQGTAQLQIFLPPEMFYIDAVLGGGGGRGDDGPPCNPTSRGDSGPTVTCNTGISPGQSVVYTVEVLVDGNFSGATESTWSTFFFNGSDPDDTDDEVTLPAFVGVSPIIFTDGFESGNTSFWGTE